MPAKFENISVKISQNFGAVTIEVGHEAGYEIDGREKRNAVYQGVMAMLQAQIKEFTRDGLTDIPSTPILGSVSTEVLHGGAVVAEMRDGEMLLRWRGGKYSKHGVPIYDEVAAKLPFEPQMALVKGGVPTDNWTIYVEVENGKPKRVAKMHPANE